MNTQLSRIALFVLFLLVSLSLVASAQDKTLPGAYSGVAVGTCGGVGGKTISFNFRITQYTTDEEIQTFAQLVKDKCTDALRRALEKEDKGRINAVGSTGNQIAVARKRQYGSDTIITIVTARTMFMPVGFDSSSGTVGQPTVALSLPPGTLFSRSLRCRTTCSQEVATVAVRQAQTARAGN
jgi:hypothetical protein